MKRKLIIQLLGLCLLLWFYCAVEFPNSSVHQKDATFSVSFRDKASGTELSMSLIDSMNLYVFKNHDTLSLTLPFDGVSADTQLTIPSGKKVRFLIHAYKDSRLIMKGDTTLTARAGETIDLSMSLGFVEPAVILTPPKQEVHIGETFWLNLAVRNMPLFYKASTRIEFNPNILKFRSVEKDDFLSQHTDKPPEFSISETDGELYHSVKIIPSAAAVSGSGNLAAIEMEALRNGMVTLMVSNDSSDSATLGIYNRNDRFIHTVNLGCIIVVN